MTSPADLRRLLAEATPLPWEPDTWYVANGLGWHAAGPRHVARDDGSDPMVMAQTDAALIAAAVNALPALLARLEELELATLRGVRILPEPIDIVPGEVTLIAETLSCDGVVACHLDWPHGGWVVPVSPRSSDEARLDILRRLMRAP